MKTDILVSGGPWGLSQRAVTRAAGMVPGTERTVREAVTPAHVVKEVYLMLKTAFLN